MSLRSAGSAVTHPLEAPGSPALGGVSGMTTGPFTPAGPLWMWARIGVSVPRSVIPKQRVLADRATSTVAEPRASGSPPCGAVADLTSLVPLSRANSGFLLLGKAFELKGDAPATDAKTTTPKIANTASSMRLIVPPWITDRPFYR